MRPDQWQCAAGKYPPRILITNLMDVAVFWRSLRRYGFRYLRAIHPRMNFLVTLKMR